MQSTTTQRRSAFKLAPGSSYELSFYQYHPTKSFPDVSLKLATTQSNIQFTGNEERRFNTRYDVKRFTFSTADLLTSFSASMLVSRVFHDERAVGFRIRDASGTIRVFPRGSTFDVPDQLNARSGILGEEPAGLRLRSGPATEVAEKDRAA